MKGPVDKGPLDIQAIVKICRDRNRTWGKSVRSPALVVSFGESPAKLTMNYWIVLPGLAHVPGNAQVRAEEIGTNPH